MVNLKRWKIVGCYIFYFFSPDKWKRINVIFYVFFIKSIYFVQKSVKQSHSDLLIEALSGFSGLAFSERWTFSCLLSILFIFVLFFPPLSLALYHSLLPSLNNWLQIKRVAKIHKQLKRALLQNWFHAVYCLQWNKFAQSLINMLECFPCKI